MRAISDKGDLWIKFRRRLSTLHPMRIPWRRMT